MMHPRLAIANPYKCAPDLWSPATTCGYVMPATVGGEAVLVAVPSGGGHLCSVYTVFLALWITISTFRPQLRASHHGPRPFHSMWRADMLPLHAPPNPVVE